MDYEKEIPFGAFDSELMHQEIFIPEGFTATINGNKIILTRIENEDEKIRQELIKFLNDCYNIDSGFFSRYCKIPFKQMLSWVEKQKHWKPSDKQMEAVKKAFRELFTRDLLDEDFVSLVNDLSDL